MGSSRLRKKAATPTKRARSLGKQRPVEPCHFSPTRWAYTASATQCSCEPAPAPAKTRRTP